MKVTKEQAEANRQGVIDAASHLLRERGLHGIALSELMQAAGLTQGGFYKKFASRDDLVRQSTERALLEARQRLLNQTANAKSDPLAALVHHYLSKEQRENQAEGCPFVALGPEIARSDDSALQAIFSDGLDRLLELLAGILSPAPDAATQDRAIVILSTMVGAITLSRITRDPALSDRFLTAATDAVLEPGQE